MRNIASLSIRLVSTCFSMSNYARWDKKRDIHDASLLVMPIFEAKRRKNKREIGTIANQGWWTQPKKPPIKKHDHKTWPIKKKPFKKGRSNKAKLRKMPFRKGAPHSQKSSISNNSVHFKLCNSDKSNEKNSYLVFWCELLLLFYFFFPASLSLIY